MGNACSKKPRDLNNQQSLAVQGVVNEEEANLLNSGKMLEDKGDIQNAMNTYVMAAKINPKSSLAYQESVTAISRWAILPELSMTTKDL